MTMGCRSGRVRLEVWKPNPVPLGCWNQHREQQGTGLFAADKNRRIVRVDHVTAGLLSREQECTGASREEPMKRSEQGPLGHEFLANRQHCRRASFEIVGRFAPYKSQSAAD